MATVTSQVFEETARQKLECRGERAEFIPSYHDPMRYLGNQGLFPPSSELPLPLVEPPATAPTSPSATELLAINLVRGEPEVRPPQFDHGVGQAFDRYPVPAYFHGAFHHSSTV